MQSLRLLKVPDDINQEHILTKEEKSKTATVFFKDGVYAYSEPKYAHILYDTRWVVWDERKYDLFNIHDILSFDITRNPSEKSGKRGRKRKAVIYLESYHNHLQYCIMHNLLNTYDKYLSVAYSYLVINLTINDNPNVIGNEFESVFKHLKRLNLDYYADDIYEQLNTIAPEFLSEGNAQLYYFMNQLNYAKQNGYDLFYVDINDRCCETCAKYQNRYYSIDGESKKFPKLPEVVFQYGSFHKNGCKYSFTPEREKELRKNEKMNRYIYDINGNCKTEQVNIIKYSNRPFEDDRSEEEILITNRYRAFERKMKKEADEEERKSLIRWREWSWLKDHFPKITPTSISGYTLIKRRNSKNYIKLKEKVAELGYILNIEEEGSTPFVTSKKEALTPGELFSQIITTESYPIPLLVSPKEIMMSDGDRQDYEKLMKIYAPIINEHKRNIESFDNWDKKIRESDYNRHDLIEKALAIAKYDIENFSLEVKEWNDITLKYLTVWNNKLIKLVATKNYANGMPRKMCNMLENAGMYEELVEFCDLAIKYGLNDDGTKYKIEGKREEALKKLPNLI